MTLSGFNMAILVVSVSCLLIQLFVRKKQTAHILFALFCGSISMTLVQKIAGDSIGPYQYLIGLGTIATCNCYWLLTRCFFRQKNVIELHHILLACTMALLLFVKQGYLFVTTSDMLTSQVLANQILTEFSKLLYSCILVLSFWEGCRGFNHADKQEKGQRVWFLITFVSAVLISRVSFVLFAENPLAIEWIVSSLILFVLINTQILMFWLYPEPEFLFPPSMQRAKTVEVDKQHVPEQQKHLLNDAEQALVERVKILLIEQQLYLKPNLKVGDIASTIDVPEYRVSKILKEHFDAKNFNQYINELRIHHAQQLLRDPSKQHWSMLVVGLESGFASVGPFGRAFKAQTGVTPNQFRQGQGKSLSWQTGNSS